MNRFLTRDSEQWYRARQNTKFLVEKRVDPRINDAFHIREAFENLGWEMKMATWRIMKMATC